VFAAMFYTISLLLAVLNIMDAFGWIFIPTQAILYPSIVVTAMWVCVIIMATIVAIDNMKENKK
jgi:hypothetical protein